MLSTIIFTALTLPILALGNGQSVAKSEEQVLASHSIYLNERFANSFVNGVFQDNILLTLSYMNGTVKNRSDINWDKVREPVTFQYQLQPGKTFAYHDGVLPQYRDKVAITSAAHFNYEDGFKSDGYLMGDGVCHLASLMYWVAKDAGLETYAPVNHNFANIPGIAREHGVSIYYNPGSDLSSGRQNLYITNNLDKPVTFKFEYKSDTELKFSISK